MATLMNTLLGNVTAYVQAGLTLYSPIYKTVWQTGTGINSNEQLMARIDPAPVTETAYFDESKTGIVPIAFYAKSKNQVTATSALDSIIDLLDVNTTLQISGALNILCKGVTIPVFVSQDDAKNYIFTCTVQVEYFAARGE